MGAIKNIIGLSLDIVRTGGGGSRGDGPMFEPLEKVEESLLGKDNESIKSMKKSSFMNIVKQRIEKHSFETL